ncbi:MAG: YgcG family protein [Betaproteobacteria bacterium]|nr:YgcG family protein [Betaproteobacteria bacterium]
MRRAARLIAALGLFLLGVALAADGLVAVPPLKARVTDLTGTLSRDQTASLEAELAQFEKARGSQIAILLLPTTQPETIEAYSIRVAEAWKLGRKGIDDGILILVARNDRKLRIEVGRGLEGAVPDAVAKRIVAEVIGPRFKEGDFFGGLQAGVTKLQAVIGGEALPPPKSAASSASGAAMDLETLFIVGIVIATMLGAVMNRWFGRLGGATVTSGVVGGLAWLVTSSVLAALIGAVLVFVFVLAFASSGRGGGWSTGGWSGGGGGWGGGSSDGGFSGGGGDFGGGGASGDW